MNNISTNNLLNFKSKMHDESDPNAILVGLKRDIGDKDHPVNVAIEFHQNGKISGIDVNYQNSHFAKGEIHERYDENGKNINYLA